MLHLIHILLLYIIIKNCSPNCVKLFQEGSELCRVCDLASYHPETLYLENFELFKLDGGEPNSTCISKDDTFIIRNVVVSSNSGGCIQCYLLKGISDLYNSLERAFLEESLIAQKYKYSEITFLLHGEDSHYLGEDYLKSYGAVLLFEGSECSITIKAMNCDDYPIMGCTDWATMLFKTNKITFIVYSQINMLNLKINGIDINTKDKFINNTQKDFDTCNTLKQTACCERVEFKSHCCTIASKLLLEQSNSFITLISSNSIKPSIYLKNIQIYQMISNKITRFISCETCRNFIIFENITIFQSFFNDGFFFSQDRYYSPGNMIIEIDQLLIIGYAFYCPSNDLKLPTLFKILSQDAVVNINGIIVDDNYNRTSDFGINSQILTIFDIDASEIIIKNITLTATLNITLLNYKANYLNVSMGTFHNLTTGAFGLIYEAGLKSIVLLQNLTFSNLSNKNSNHSFLDFYQSQIQVYSINLQQVANLSIKIIDGKLVILQLSAINCSSQACLFCGEDSEFLFKQLFLSGIRINSYLLYSERRNISISNSIFQMIEAKGFANLIDYDFFCLTSVFFRELTQMPTLVAPGNLFNRSLFKFCYFLNNSVKIFYSFYTANKLNSVVVFEYCLFDNIKIQVELFFICCTTFYLNNTKFLRNTLENTALALASFEIGTKILIHNIIIINSGLQGIPEFSKGFNNSFYFSPFFLWYASYFNLENGCFIFNSETTVPNGILATSSFDGYVVLINIILFSKRLDEPSLTKAFIIGFARGVIAKNITLKNLGCPQGRFKMTYLQDNGAFSIINNQQLGGDFRNEKYVYLSDITFENSSCQNGGGLTIINYKFIQINNLSVINASAFGKGGLLFIMFVQELDLSNITVRGSRADTGGFLHLSEIKKLNLDNSSFSNGQSQAGAGIYLYKIVQAKLSNFIANNHTSYSDSGLFYLEATSLKLTGACISNMKGVLGGSFSVSSLANLEIQNIYIYNTTASKAGGFLYSEDAEVVKLTDVHLANTTSFGVSSIVDLNTYYSFQVVNLFIKQAVSKEKAAFWLKSSKINCVTSFENLIIAESFSITAFVILFESTSDMQIKNLSILSGNGGEAIWIHQSGRVSIFIENFYLADNYLRSFIKSNNIDLSLNHGFIEENNFSGNFFELLEASLVFKDGQIQFNNGFTQKYSVVSIFLFSACDSIIMHGLYVFNLKTPDETAGYSPSFMNCDNIEIYLNSTILKGFSLLPSDRSVIKAEKGILVLENLEIIDSECLIEMKLSQINLTMISVILRLGTQVSTFLLQDRGNLFILQSALSLMINDHCFKLNLVSNVLLYLTYITRKESQYQTGSGGIDILSAKNITILQVIASNMSSSKGSFLTVNEERGLRAGLRIESSHFENCTAVLGGVIFTLGIVDIIFIDCVFISNKVLLLQEEKTQQQTGVGGVSFLECPFNELCTFLMKNCEFYNNFAELYSPTLFLLHYSIIESEANFSENYDKCDYGRNLGTPVFCTVILIGGANDKLSCNKSNQTIEVLSGQIFSPTLVLLDYFGNPLNYDNETIISLRSLTGDISSSFGQMISTRGSISFPPGSLKLKPGTTSILALELEIRKSFFSNEKVQKKFYLTIKSIPCPVGSIILYDLSCIECGMNTYSLVDPMNIDIKEQKCHRCLDKFDCFGKNLTFPNRGYWRSTEKIQEILNCPLPKSCLSYIVSNGTTSIKPCEDSHYGILCVECKPGFGRYGRFSLCESCDIQRPYYVLRVVIICFLVLTYILVNTYIFTKQIKKTDSAEHSSPSTSPFIIFKLILNHFQQLGLILVVKDIDSLPLFNEFVSFQNYLAFINEDIVSIDCILNRLYDKKFTNIYKVVALVILPLLLGLGAFVFWFFTLILFAAFKKKFSYRLSKNLRRILISLLISAYLLYPLIIQTMFTLANCQEINTENGFIKVLSKSPNINCWESDHLFYFLTVFIPSFLLWGIIFPLILFILLRKTYYHEKSLVLTGSSDIKSNFMKNIRISKRRMSIRENLQFTMSKYSSIMIRGNIFRFFHEDYKKECYYWEIIIFFKKFLLNSLISNRAFIGEESCNLLLILLLLCYCSILLKLEPFNFKTGNFFELASNLIAIFSMNLVRIGQDKSLVLFRSAFYIIFIILNSLWGFLLVALFIKMLSLDKKLHSLKVLISHRVHPTANTVKNNLGATTKINFTAARPI